MGTIDYESQASKDAHELSLGQAGHSTGSPYNQEGLKLKSRLDSNLKSSRPSLQKKKDAIKVSRANKNIAGSTKQKSSEGVSQDIWAFIGAVLGIALTAWAGIAPKISENNEWVVYAIVMFGTSYICFKAHLLLNKLVVFGLIGLVIYFITLNR